MESPGQGSAASFLPSPTPSRISHNPGSNWTEFSWGRGGPSCPLPPVLGQALANSLHAPSNTAQRGSLLPIVLKKECEEGWVVYGISPLGTPRSHEASYGRAVSCLSITGQQLHFSCPVLQEGKVNTQQIHTLVPVIDFMARQNMNVW